MKLTVRLFAHLRERAGRSEIRLEDLAEDLDVAGLKREIERREPSLGTLARVRGAVGTEYVPETRKLADGETVSLIPPVSGGAPDAGEALRRGVFELCEGPIDPARAHERVRDPSFGGISTFTGTTRAENQGKRVVRLEYEAFAEMTAPEMARIFDRCRETVATSNERELRMVVMHRVGVVQVGEASVAIAVSSPHRDAAFAACRFLIDELKRSLPIWKKEVYQDGAAWIGERS